MKVKIKLPFSEIIFENANQKHKEYFSKLFFRIDNKYPKSIYSINVKFEKLKLTKQDKIYLEEDITASNNSIYISDTKGNLIKISPDSLKKTKIVLIADPDFDLYYLYNYIIEPLLIIWAAQFNILFVHASAFYKKAKGSQVFAAWRHTGKTSSIFSMVNEDIEFMGDDFCIINNSKVFLYPKYINIFSYNFLSYPWLFDKLSTPLAYRIKISIFLKKILYAISQKIKGPFAKVFFRLSELAEISTNTQITPDQIGLKTKSDSELGRLVFIMKASSKKRSRKLSKEEIASKLLNITQFEIKDFLEIYQKMKFINPNTYIALIEDFDKNYRRATIKNINSASEAYIQSLPHKDAYFYE